MQENTGVRRRSSCESSVLLERFDHACLKVLAHPARLRMVDILLQGEFPVREIARLCDLPAHQVCEHLRLMQGHGLLASDRRGREVYYRIAAPELPRIIACIRDTCVGGVTS